jgi:hypothetical protein
MSASNANPTGEVGTDQDINQGADFDTQNIPNASTDESGAVVDAEKPTNKELNFKAKDIVKTEGKDYFVNIDQREKERLERKHQKAEDAERHRAKVEENRENTKKRNEREGKAIHEFIFGHKKRTAILAAVIVLVIAGLVVLFAYGIPELSRRIAKDKREQAAEQAIQQYNSNILTENDIFAEMGRIYDAAEDKEEGRKAASEYIEKQIEDAGDDCTRKIGLATGYATFTFKTFYDYGKALEILNSVSSCECNDARYLADYNMRYYTIYTQLGQKDRAEESYKKYLEYSKELEELGPQEDVAPCVDEGDC